jgi:hypothetical protein
LGFSAGEKLEPEQRGKRALSAIDYEIRFVDACENRLNDFRLKAAFGIGGTSISPLCRATRAGNQSQTTEDERNQDFSVIVMRPMRLEAKVTPKTKAGFIWVPPSADCW